MVKILEINYRIIDKSSECNKNLMGKTSNFWYGNQKEHPYSLLSLVTYC